MKTLFYFLIALISLNSFKTNAQGKISGQITDDKNKIVEFANVTLLKAKDSTLVKGALSDQSGSFEFEKITYGDYIVNISQLGYKKFYTPKFTINSENGTVKLSNLVMQEDSKQLSEVQVVAKKPFIEQQIDKTVVNVENSIVSAGSTALEVLEKSPGVTVDKDGNISLKGKQNVMVMMDGKPTYMSASDLANLLRNMQSSQVDKIELMTNPPAKYDAAGNAGVINIKMKKNQNMGLNGSATLGLGYGFYQSLPKENASLNLNYRQGKVNVFGNFSGNNRKSFQINDIKRKFVENGKTLSGFDQIANSDRQNSSFSYKVGADYFIDSKNTIGVLFNGMNGNWKELLDNQAIIKNSLGMMDSTSITKGDINNNWGNYSTNVNFKHIIDSTGKEWTMDADYARYDSDNNMKYRTSKYDINNILRQTRNEDGLTASKIDIYSLKADLVFPINKKAKFEAGVKSSYVNSNNDMRFEFLVGDNNNRVLDPTRTRGFLYKENINAGYVNYSQQFKKLSVQLGLRVENTNGQGTLQGKELLNRNYTNLFPSIYLREKLSAKHQLGLSYSRRIDRPSYEDLNPFLFFLDPYTFEKGNELLQPQYTDAIEMSHTFMDAITTTINYSRTNGVMTQILEQNNALKLTNVTKFNIGYVDNFGISFSVPVPITKWWFSNTYFNLYNNHYVGDIPKTTVGADGVATTIFQPLDARATTYQANMTHQFTLPKKFSIELSGWYQSPFVEAQLIGKPMGAVSFGVQKKFLKDKATLKLNVNDVFWSNSFRGSFAFNDIDVQIANKWESRVARLTFTYRFGNNKVQASRQRQTGLEAEKGRVKNGGN
ncbi:outer membrane receptor protein involved in Fe transport [Arcicella aurantiaca]|uniref:Outer membrane receptor protein involved in Fe transport n=1 Tax=Arcicella aurantiaca TaxID=591202 RepID=A0A316ECN8_9BACT|nr:outer membrane beta-barrel protein [Arcicella aurantiaca]PWK28642.1 outer membrane receptor protein involved in Fe transport [Arcicella aurantiaca]